MPETSPNLTPDDNDANINALLEKYWAVGLSGMTSGEVDALDEAIEMGYVNESELGGSDAA